MRPHRLNSFRTAGASVAAERPMPKRIRAWLLIAVSLAGAIVLDDWLGSTTYGGFAVVAVLATVTAAVITHAADSQRPTVPPPAISPARPSHLSRPPLAAAELALAIEHIQSIRVLLGISSSHRQPVPHGVLVNLDLVLKHLRNIDHTSAASTENGVTTTAASTTSSPVQKEELMPVFRRLRSFWAGRFLAATIKRVAKQRS
jgi:hypothetical protein